MCPVELRRERLESEFLDPRRDFEPVRLPLEIRWDPLTGESCRLLPAGSLPQPEQQDLDELASQTRPACPGLRRADRDDHAALCARGVPGRTVSPW
jgi:hypothetical protein